MALRISRPGRAVAAAWLCSAALILLSGTASAASAWEDVRATVATRSLANNGSIYVAVGSNGIWTSQDLKTWTRAALPSAAGMLYNDVLWDGTRFIAVGYGVVSSTDGATWTLDRAPDGDHDWIGVTAMGTVHVVVGSIIANSGSANDVLRSTNGKNWALVSLPSTIRGLGTGIVGDADLRGVANDGTQFAAVGMLEDKANSQAQDYIITSPDGLTWTAQSLTPGGFYAQGNSNGAAWGNGTFTVGGSFGTYTSPDGVTWTGNDITNLSSDPNAPAWYMNQIRFLNGSFISAGFDAHSDGKEYAAIFTSADGVTWAAKDIQPRGSSLFGLSGVSFDAGKYVVAGYQGVYKSGDGTTWGKVSSGPQTVLPTCVINAGGRYVIVGGTGSLVSTAADTWPDAVSSSGPQGSAYGPGCAAYGAGVYVVVPGGTLGTGIQWSADGKTWNSATVTDPAYAVAWDGQQFLALGYDSSNDVFVQTSKDGKTWTAQSGVSVPSGTIVFKSGGFGGGGLIYQNGRYVAWGTLDGGPMILTSTDGLTWHKATLEGTATSPIIAAIAFGNDEYVAIANDADNNTMVFHSSDGSHWSLHAGTLPDGQWYSLAWSGNGFMASGGDLKTGRGIVLASNASGSTWAKTSLDTTALYDLTWDGTGYLAVSGYDFMRMVPESDTGGGGTGGGGTGKGGGAGGSSGGGGALGLGLLGLLLGFTALRRRFAT